MPRERTGASYTVKASRSQDQSAHHQVRHATYWAAAMDARTREYEAARAGQMTDEEMRRVDINPRRL